MWKICCAYKSPPPLSQAVNNVHFKCHSRGNRLGLAMRSCHFAKGTDTYTRQHQVSMMPTTRGPETHVSILEQDHLTGQSGKEDISDSALKEEIRERDVPGKRARLHFPVAFLMMPSGLAC